MPFRSICIAFVGLLCASCVTIGSAPRPARNQGFGAQGAAGDPKPQMFNQGFGAQGAAGDPKPQMFNQGVKPVGFLVRDGVDASRPFGERPARPLRVGVWYSAERAEGLGLSLEEYGRRLTISEASAPVIHTGRLPGPMGALLNAPPDGTPTPLVVYLPGFGASATAHALACERLARHGYTVLSMASMRSTPVGMSFDLEGVEAQRRDAEWGIAAAEAALGRRFSRIAMIGVSFGSLAGYRLLTGGDERMMALVSLDGSLGFVDGAAMMAANRPDRPPRQAILHMNTLGNGYNDLSLLGAQPFSLVQIATFAGYEHNEFFPGKLLRTEPGSEAAALASRRLDVVLSLAMRFIDAQFAVRRECVMAADAASMECLTPRLEVPAESAAARLLMDDEGRARVLELGRRAQSLGIAEPVVREGLVEAAGNEAEGRAKVALLRLQVALFPRSYRAFWSLGEALGESGDIAGAIEAFETVKAINPKVRDADDEIKKLRGRLGERHGK